MFYQKLYKYLNLEPKVNMYTSFHITVILYVLWGLFDVVCVKFEMDQESAAYIFTTSLFYVL